MTERQADLLRFIAAFKAEHAGGSPTLTQCMAALGLVSKTGILRLLAGLEERGHLTRLPDRQRTIVLAGPAPVSRAPDGTPLVFIPASPAGRAAGERHNGAPGHLSVAPAFHSTPSTCGTR